MSKKKYVVSKTRAKKSAIGLDVKDLTGYKVTPKIVQKDAIEVSKITFINKACSEKIIRKKIDNKIKSLLEELKDIEDNGGDMGSINKTLMAAEKLRMQIINKYVKYLGHTYESLTLRKIQVIIETLEDRIYLIEASKQFLEEMKSSGRGR